VQLQRLIDESLELFTSTNYFHNMTHWKSHKQNFSDLNKTLNSVI